MKELQKFKEIFQGLDCAYGTYKIERTNDNNKRVGKAFTIAKPPLDELWRKHLEGVEPSLGIIPIRADNSCTWGAIDIDQYPLDLNVIIAKVKSFNLPLVTLRSKSGGAHVYAFVKNPVPAADMQKYLNACASLLGQAGREIFPKQSQILVERGDTGNFLNLPYFNCDSTLRYAIKPDGSAATLEEFFEIYEANVQDGLKTPAPPQKKDQPAPNGPPCLQALCSQGFPEGTRNNGLFNVGIYLRKADPSGWEDKLMEYNQKYFNPPLPLKEIQLISKQLEKKEYKYKCKDEPIKSFCNAGVCRQRTHGIGGDGAETPQLSALSKYNSEPPLWFLDVNGKRVELETDHLFNQMNFQKACMERLNILPPSVKKIDWEQMINELLGQMVEMEHITEASEDTTISGRFRDLVEEFTTHIQQAMDRDEILMGRVWTDEKEGITIFRIKDLEAHLKRNSFVGLSAPKMAQRLRDMGGSPTSITLKGRATRIWKMPVFAMQEAPFETSDHDEVPF